MIISVLEKIMPAAVKTLGKPAVLQLIGGAGLIAGGTNFILDKTVGPVMDKGVEAAKEALTTANKKKAELEAKKAAILAQKEAEMITTEEPAEVKVEEKPNTSKKKNK